MKQRKLRLVSLLGIALSAFFSTGYAAEAEPFQDAVGLWHFADASAAGGEDLIIHDGVRLGTELTPAETEQSRLRGGDGFAADFTDGGWLDAGLGLDKRFDLDGGELSIYLRLCGNSDSWTSPIFSRHGGHLRLAYNIFCVEDSFGGEVGTTRNRSVMSVRAPFAEMKDAPTAARRWHDIVLRLNGAKLELFVDGRCTDEDFMLGKLRKSGLPIFIGAERGEGDSMHAGFRGLIDTAALWDRALTDEEILFLSGGSENIDSRQRTDSGKNESLQYWMPPNRYGVGDCMPFCVDGVFHFMYLLDKGHHSAKNGLGAHQWIQATSTDLVHWTHQPFVVDIDQQNEGSICTGSVFYHDGIYYAFYANRSAVYETPEAENPTVCGWLCRSVSTDGIHFKKDDKPFLIPPEGYAAGTRDPKVFQHPETGQFHLYATTSYKGYGCWLHAVSDDLNSWTILDPIYTNRDGEPECPDYFHWGNYYYVIAGHTNGFWRMSSSPTGPWEIPLIPNQLMTGIINVPKTAPFGENRRIICGWSREHGFGGHSVFHELIQYEDGTLGEKFVPEMMPKTASPLTLEQPGNRSEMTLSDLPKDERFYAELSFNPDSLDSLRDVNFVLDGRTLTVSPRKRSVKLGDFSLERIDFSSGKVTLEAFIKGDLCDLCVNGCRTVTDAVAEPEKRTLTIQNDTEGKISIEKMEIAPLIP